MSMNVVKTKGLRIAKKMQVTFTKEAEVEATLKHPHVCERCGKSYPNKHYLAVHQGRWCTGDRARMLEKGTDHRQGCPSNQERASEQPILLGSLPLENVGFFVYVGGLLMSHGGTEEEVEQRIGLAQGAVNQLQLGSIWTS